MQNGTPSKSSWSFLTDCPSCPEEDDWKNVLLSLHFYFEVTQLHLQLFHGHGALDELSWTDWLNRVDERERCFNTEAQILLSSYCYTNASLIWWKWYWECQGLDTMLKIKKILFKFWNSLEQTLIFWRLFSFFIDCFYLLLAMSRATKNRGNFWKLWILFRFTYERNRVRRLLIYSI